MSKPKLSEAEIAERGKELNLTHPDRPVCPYCNPCSHAARTRLCACGASNLCATPDCGFGNVTVPHMCGDGAPSDA